VKVSEAMDLLRRHVALFNEGVRTGDFGPMLEHFTEDAELAFEGVPAGPYKGGDVIARAYREQPPDDQLDVLEAREVEDGLVIARYAWRREPRISAGEMRITLDGDRIAKLVVTFDAPAAAGEA
jgi:hypothetical protein